MRATDFEFSQRFWIFGGIIGVGFGLYNLDHVNAAVGLVNAFNSSLTDAAARPILQAIFALAALLIALAALLRTWATSYLKASVVMDKALHSEALVADGPYRHTRNPLYFANFLMFIGFAFFASRVGAVVIIAGLTVFTLRLIGREEEGLRASQGESYRNYCAAVPRLWPSFSACVPAGAGTAHWGQAFLGESMFWGFAIAGAAFAATLNLKLYWWLLGISLVFAIVILPLIQRAKKKSG